MNLLAHHILGKTLESAQKTESYHLSFGDVFLTIYNPVEIEFDNTHADLYSLKGLVVKEVREAESDVTIIMNCNVSFRIDLRPQAYTGPEAMVLRVAGDGFVVW
jgi:hypothetical protein